MRNLHCVEVRTCKLCGSPFPFNATPSKVAAGHGLFCSGICQRRGRRQRQLEDSFFARIGRLDSRGCFLWKGTKNKAGYGTLSSVLVHRIAYEFFLGPIPEGIHVLHNCDNPPCVNPAHLFLGTNLDNIEDKLAKGRQAKGEMFNRKLAEAAIRAIRNGHAEGRSQAELAKEHGIHQSHISKIVNRKLWSHLR